MNPLFNMLMGGNTGMPQMPMGGNNPIAKLNMAMQAMRDPAGFVRNAIPDLPANISNDPRQILGYLQQTRGITNEQIQQLMQNMPPMPRY